MFWHKKKKQQQKNISNQAVNILSFIEFKWLKTRQISPWYNPSLYILSSLQQNSDKNTLL